MPFIPMLQLIYRLDLFYGKSITDEIFEDIIDINDFLGQSSIGSLRDRDYNAIGTTHYADMELPEIFPVLAARNFLDSLADNQVYRGLRQKLCQSKHLGEKLIWSYLTNPRKHYIRFDYDPSEHNILHLRAALSTAGYNEYDIDTMLGVICGKIEIGFQLIHTAFFDEMFGLLLKSKVTIL